jgi:very-short-patch-repair endonuclease
VAGVERTWYQRVLGCCLAVGPPVAASHLTAGRLWDFEALREESGVVHLSVPRGRSARAAAGARVHRVDLDFAGTRVRHKVPVTSALRTLADLAQIVGTDLLSRCTDEALRRQLIVPWDLQALRVATHGRRGAPAVDRVADLRTSTNGVGESEWEDRIYRWLVDAGLPPPKRQYPVLLPSGPVRLDMAYPESRVDVEFDGWEWHRDRRRFDRDRQRDAELTLAGWAVIRVTSAHPEAQVVAQVRQALQQGNGAPA